VGPDTLVVGSSHSGGTEETLSACEQALARGAKLLAITTGGKLAALAEQTGGAVWRFKHSGAPRSAVGLSFMLTLSVLVKLGVVKDKTVDVAEAVAAMRAQQAAFLAGSPVTRNPAKRMAGQLLGRFGAIFASDFLAPVARRWNGQLTEVAKAWAQFAELPEMNHNQVVGTMYPAELVSKFMVLFLRSATTIRATAARSDAQFI
jgi:glucose/mannose-6-phosphate isomerase